MALIVTTRTIRAFTLQGRVTHLVTLTLNIKLSIQELKRLTYQPIIHRQLAKQSRRDTVTFHMKYDHTTSREMATTNKGEVNWSEITAAGTSYLIASFKEKGNNS